MLLFALLLLAGFSKMTSKPSLRERLFPKREPKWLALASDPAKLEELKKTLAVTEPVERKKTEKELKRCHGIIGVTMLQQACISNPEAVKYLLSDRDLARNYKVRVTSAAIIIVSLPWTKKRTIPRFAARRTLFNICDIMLDHERSAQQQGMRDSP